MNRIELYAEADVQEAIREMNTRLCAFFALCGVTLGVFVTALILRIQIPALIVTAVLSCAVYCFYSTKVSPYVKYCRYLREMGDGLSRETVGFFGAIAETPRTVDGVDVYDFILRVDEGETDERLFLWDADKKSPGISPGQSIRVTSHSNFVKALELL